MSDDAELLRRYAEENSEEAFTEVVRRHLGLVYHAALRQTGGDAHRAEDATQAVFTDLARKARTLARRPSLVGWLYTSTRYAALHAVRTERRRQAREQEVHAMNELLGDSEPAVDWERLRPVIDDALHALNERDREAVLLRFFEGRSFADVGAKLFVSEDAARVRVDRALAKMRTTLERHQVTSTAAGIGLALANHAAAATPAGLAASISHAALTGAAGGIGTLAAVGSLFTMSKIKLGIVGALVLAAGGTAIVEVRANRGLKAELRELNATDQAISQAQKEHRELTSALAKRGENNAEVDELSRLRQRAVVLKARPPGVVEAELKLASTWQDQGRATPEATWESFCFAVRRDDLDAVSRFIVFREEASGEREAFMAKLSEPVRARYRTPERLCAAALFNVGAGIPTAPDDAFQILSVRDLGLDRVQIESWVRRNGHEFPGRDSYTKTADGWAIVLRPMAHPSLMEVIQSRIDPQTGNVLVHKK
jgi:RNA polymerase sigma factor (sigma-70 family)